MNYLHDAGFLNEKDYNGYVTVSMRRFPDQLVRMVADSRPATVSSRRTVLPMACSSACPLPSTWDRRRSMSSR